MFEFESSHKIYWGTRFLISTGLGHNISDKHLDLTQLKSLFYYPPFTFIFNFHHLILFLVLLHVIFYVHFVIFRFCFVVVYSYCFVFHYLVISPELVREVEARMNREYTPPSCSYPVYPARHSRIKQVKPTLSPLKESRRVTPGNLFECGSVEELL